MDTLTALEQIVEVETHCTRTFYSAKLSLKDTNISVEGKGYSISYCLASAFGELYERLINLVPFRFTYNIFYNCKTVPYPYALCSNEKYKEYFYNYITKLNTNASLSSQLFDLLTRYESYGNLTTYMHDMNEPTQHYPIPTRLLDLLYGTNGMSTGNSKDEALCQSFCEIIERHYLRKLLHTEVQLYKITNRVLMSDAYATIINDFKLNGLEIDVYLIPNDIGVSICVLSIVHTDIEHIFCKMGVHPIESFAIERTFTELFQNRGIINIKAQLQNSQGIDFDYYSLENFIGICKNDNGFFSKKILDLCIPTYNCNIMYSNYTEACTGIIEYFYKHNYHICYCYYELHNMHTYQVIIPQYSELISPIEISTDMITYNQNILSAKSLLSRIRELNTPEYTKLYQILNSEPTLTSVVTSDYFRNCSANMKVDWENLKKVLCNYCEYKISQNKYGNALSTEEFLPYNCQTCPHAGKCSLFQTTTRLLGNLIKTLSKNTLEVQ